MTEDDQLSIEVPEDEGNLIDEAEADETVAPNRYGITSFGADYDVDGLVKRLNRGDLFIPAFQREFVWSQREASRFIESLLLGLPVPGVILAREAGTNKLLVIDGQQRLKTLQFFFGGYFNPRSDDKIRRVFTLQRVQERYDGRTYATLDEADRIHLDNAIIHATVVKQDFPEEDDTSIYHIFERLNTAGRRLFPHEIRLAICYGELMDRLKELNEVTSWRAIFGKKNQRLKDQELILRFLALYEDYASYRRPMAEFLNHYAMRNRNPGAERLAKLEALFVNTISAIYGALGQRAFRPQSAINAAIYDAVMVAVARRLDRRAITQPGSLRAAYEGLLADELFLEVTSRSTSDNTAVSGRLERATKAIAVVE